MNKLAAAGAAAFLAIVLLVPVLRTDGYSAMRDSISEGALGPRGWLMTVGFVLLGLGSLAFAALVRRRTSGNRGAIASGLLLVWAVGIFVSAAVPVDPGALGATTGGKVHLAAAFLAFLAVLAAMWLSAAALASDPHATGTAGRWRGLAALATVLLVVMAAAPQESSWGGLAQRAFVASVLAWIIAVSLAAPSEAAATTIPAS